MTNRFDFARPELGDDEARAVQEVLASGWVTQGPKVAAFERDMSALCESAHAVAVSSCTTALHLSLVCAGVGGGDEVIVPSMSFIATANAVVHAGARPVFAEVEAASFNLDIDDVRNRITPRTKAIILVDQLGMPADRDGFTELARSAGIALIEDAACAIGSRYHGAPVGSTGDFVCFSFHPRKVVTTGDGGMILTASAEHAERLRRLRQHAMSISDVDRHGTDRVVHERYDEVGYNFRMTDLQAAIGIVQLRRLPEILRRRRALREAYDAVLAPHAQIATPVVPPDCEWNVQTYSVRLQGHDAAARDRVMQRLLDRGIPTRRAVMLAHQERAYSDLASRVSLPVSEAASACSLALPLHTGMTPEDCELIAEELTEAVDPR